MKANELQIGDYVNYRGQIIKVTSLYDKGGSNEVGWSDKESVWVNASNVEPIPLTTEILKKNGHKVPGYSVWELEADGAEVQWVRETMDNINPPMQFRLAPRQKNVGVQETLICHIKYVHELQHALRLCGIEKEIKL